MRYKDGRMALIFLVLNQFTITIESVVTDRGEKGYQYGSSYISNDILYIIQEPNFVIIQVEL